MLRNEVTLCDMFENEIGVCSKEEAHREGKLHRAFSVFLINGNKVMIQKRAKTKYHTPSLWTNSCCSHTRKGENVVESAEKRCYEELGINVKLKKIFDFVYYYKFREDLIEYEYDNVLIGNYNGEFNLDKEEAEDYKWVEINDLLNMVVNEPSKFTPWFIICLPKIAKYINNENK